jgi:ADP-heptose:LPS heptosyltransferase
VKSKLKKNIYSHIKKLIRKIAIILFDRKKILGVIKPFKHILLINWNGKIGDAIVSSFLFREIRKIENITISVITTEHLKSLYTNYYNADNVYIVKNGFTLFDLIKVLNKIKDVDTIVPSMGILGFKEIYFISKLNPKNVFSLDEELGLSNIKISENLFIHEIFYFILQKLDVHDINDKYIVPINMDNLKFVKGYDILLNPFASRIDKSLSIEKSIEILNLIGQTYPNKNIGVIYSPNTKKIAFDIMKKVIYENIYIIDYIDSFYDSINLINKSNIIISVDTSIVHIASGLNKKLIAIYYKKDNVFNSWLPKKSSNTKVIFSLGTEHDLKKNMNNFDSYEIIKIIEYFIG